MMNDEIIESLVFGSTNVNVNDVSMKLKVNRS
jgi:hypothetical protein